MMEGYKRILILSGMMAFPLLVWMNFADSNDPISLVPEAFGSEHTEDHSEGKTDDQQHEGMVGMVKDDLSPVDESRAHEGSILLPQKRTTLLSRIQLRGYAPYQFYCAACHGTRGNGDGSNVKNLSIPPRKHNDSAYMANLSDDHLIRIIKKGGSSQGLSPLMPPWGGVLSDEEILNLIAFLRILPDARMVASAEKYHKSAGMGGMGGHHGEAGGDDHGTEADEPHAAGEEDDHGTVADEPHAAGEEDNHGTEADEQHAAGTDDHHAN